MKTTLNKITALEKNEKLRSKLLAGLGKTEPDDEPLDITSLFDILGFTKSLAFLEAFEGYDKELRIFAVRCVRQVQHLIRDKGLHDLIDDNEESAGKGWAVSRFSYTYLEEPAETIVEYSANHAALGCAAVSPFQAAREASLNAAAAFMYSIEEGNTVFRDMWSSGGAYDHIRKVQEQEFRVIMNLPKGK